MGQLLILLIALNIIIRLPFLDSPKQAYFDENYFVPAIRNTISDLPDLTNEQPLLAKNIIVASVKLFGDNPWGWRIPSVIFGTLMAYATYLLAKTIFGGKRIPLLSMTFMTFEFVLFIHSRILMMEVFFATFVTFAFVFLWSYLKKMEIKNLVLSGLFFGFAASVKWAVSLPLSLALLFLLTTNAKLSEKLRAIILLFTTVATIYLLLYVPLIARVGVGKWITLQQQVWYYHTIQFPIIHKQLAPTYVPQYQKTKIFIDHIILWPLNPGALYFEKIIEPNKISVVLFFANPIVFWGGLIALCFTLFKKRREKKILFVNGIFLSSYLPLFLIPPPVFGHYLLFGLPALAIILSYFLIKILKLSKKSIIAIVALTIIIFCLYYPLLTAMTVPKWYLHLLTRF